MGLNRTFSFFLLFVFFYASLLGKATECANQATSCKQIESIERAESPTRKRPQDPGPSSPGSPHKRPRHGSRSPSPHHESDEAVYSFFAERLNTSVDPCDDFYEFACGGYTSRHRAQSPTDYFSTKKEQSDCANADQLKLIMTRQARGSHAVNMMLEYRDKCLDVDKIKRENSTRLWANMKEFGQGFPIFELAAFDPAVFQFDYLLLKMSRASGTHFMYKIGVQETGQKHFLPIIQSPALLVSSPDFYSSGNVQFNENRLCFYIDKVLCSIATDNNLQIPADLDVQIRQVVNFDKQLAQVLINHRSHEPEIVRKRLFIVKSELIAVYWEIYLDHSPLIPVSIKDCFRRQSIVALHEENAIKAVDKLYYAIKTNNSRLVANYFYVRFILDQLPYLNRELFSLYHNFNNHVYATPKPQSRADDCFNMIWKHFGLSIDSLYATHFLKPNILTMINSIFDNLSTSMKRMLMTQSWMSSDSKRHALDKLNGTRRILGIVAVDYLKREYQGLNLTSQDSFLQMTMKLKKHRNYKVMMQLYKPSHALVRRWPTTEVSVRNELRRNRIVLSTGVLQPPFLDHTQPLAISYGLVGFLAARELTHGFDDSGSLFNATGGHRDWWDAVTQTAFRNKAEELIDLFAQQVNPLTGKTVDGLRTLDENIADSGGIRVVFDAYKDYRNRNPDSRVRGFDKYDSHQTFFISYALASREEGGFCSSSTEERAAKLMKTDIHSPDRVRVNTVLANYPVFARIFKCKKGKKMNPHEKFTVWTTQRVKQ